MQNQVNQYSVFGPVQTAGQFRFRQGGTSFRLLPSFCRGRDYGRKRGITRALPKVLRPPREYRSQPLISGYAAIVLNDFHNGDGPAEPDAPSP